MSPCQLPCVCRQEACVEAGVVSPGEKRYGEFVVMGHVQLEKARCLAVCFGNFLDGLRAGSREGVREIELFGDSGDGEFAVFVVDFVDAYGSEADGCGDLMIEDLGARVAKIGVDKLPWYYSMAVKGLS